MKFTTKVWTSLAVIALCAIPVAYVMFKAPSHNIAEDLVSSGTQVDRWDLQSTYDMVLDAYDDPKLPVTCGVSHIVDTMAFNDPSNMSVTCRATGIITAEMIAKLPKSEDIFSRDKGIGFKTIYIRRSIDNERGLINYISYSSAAISGSFQNSLSSVTIDFNSKDAPKSNSTDIISKNISECIGYARNGNIPLAEACMDAVESIERARLIES